MWATAIRHRDRAGQGCGLAQSVEHVTLDLGVVSSSPMLGEKKKSNGAEDDLFPIYLFILDFFFERRESGEACP